MDRKKRSGSKSHLLIESLEARQLLSSSGNVTISPSLVIDAAASKSTTIAGYTPAEIKAAYGISAISFAGVTGTGAGQTIAIVDAYSDPNIVSDLAVFDKEFGLSTASLTQESSTGSTTKLPAENADWDGEISLDVEWAHAVAPSAKIILVDASSDSLSGLMSAVEYARTISSVSVISMSWGSSEFSGETAYDKYFTTPTGHIGITFVAASGDEGASGGAEWPAASPNVLSVGGTTLSLSTTGTVESESAWSDSSGGVSTVESTPTYQSSVSSSGRSVPDVSYDADPDTGFAVYDSVSDDGYVGWQEVGGTSAGAPQWAALIAITDQGRVINGLGTLDGATGTLPAIYSIYSNSTSYAADFTDITSGSSVLSEGGGGGFGGGGFGGGFGGGGRGRGQTVEVTATLGYDTLTGLGTPKAAALVEALASTKVSTATASTKTVSTAKVVKTAKVSAAVEFDRPTPAFEVMTFTPTALVSLQRQATNLEVETMTASTAAATMNAPAARISNAVTLSAPTSQLEAERPAETGYPDAAAVENELSTSLASGAVRVASAPVHSSASSNDTGETASTMMGRFSETAIAKTFRDALDEFSEACEALPSAAAVHPHHRSSSSPNMAVIGAAVAADVVLLGYLYSKRKKGAAELSIFNDELIR